LACDRTRIDDWCSVRALDPTCGSGTFLLEVIRRKRKHASENNLKSAEILQNVLENVWGFDLNPLAVQAARTNFLIAIADLVAETKMEVELPVLLADAVYSPAYVPNAGDDFVEYRIGSAQSDLRVILPTKLASDRVRLDKVFAIMAAAVERESDYKIVESSIVTQKVIKAAEAKAWRDALTETYSQVLRLHQKDWNGIWFRIVRNFFWSAIAGRFDVVIGNPPWVRWSNLPEIYRNRIKPTCEQYAIFSETPYHGGNELDISGMITYTVGDKWLKDGGTLVFVITQTHFQSPSSQGFRSFSINSDASFIPAEIDDMKKLKPFPKVANKTAIMRLNKVSPARPPVYPITYRVWEKSEKFSASIPEASKKNDVLKRATINNWEATPVGGGNSPWAILPKGHFKRMTPIQGESDWLTGRKGITTDLNGVFMVRILDLNETEKLVQIETRPEAGKIDIGPRRRYWIEPNILFPLLKGASDFSACHVHPGESLFTIVPNQGIGKSDYKLAQETVDGLINTKRYLDAYEDVLRGRSTYRLRQKGAPFFSIYNSGPYTFAPYKVVWAELSTTFEAAVVTNAPVPLIGSRPYVPDHKIYFAEFSNTEDALFICGLLNCNLVREYVESHTIQIQVSNIFKHLNLPRYDSQTAAHRRIVELCKKAHSATNDNRRTDLMSEMSQVSEKVLKGQ